MLDLTAWLERSYTKLGDCNVQHTSDHNQGIEWIPRINEVMLHRRKQRNVRVKVEQTWREAKME